MKKTSSIFKFTYLALKDDPSLTEFFVFDACGLSFPWSQSGGLSIPGLNLPGLSIPGLSFPGISFPVTGMGASGNPNADSLLGKGRRRRNGGGKANIRFPERIESFFTCGEADRSRHGKCCSSCCCCCCCWGDHFHFTSLMYTQKGCEKKNLCQKIGVKKENFFQ